jgi:hypothetical protein
MTLADLARRDNGPRWQECTIHYALRSLPTDLATALRDALDNDRVGHQEIADELKPLHVATDGGTVGRHRGGRCKCDACGCPVCAG